MRGVSSLLDAAASLFLGAACPGCGTPAWRLCAACADALAHEQLVSAALTDDLVVWGAASYAGMSRQVIVAYKEHRAWGLRRPLGQVLALAVAASLETSAHLLLVPMPSQTATVRERGLDTTLALAQTAAKTLRAAGVPTKVDACLRHTRRVRDQSELSMTDRTTNLLGALVAQPRGEGVRVLVDDLATTGSSLREAARALRVAGTPASSCAVVALTPRRDGRAGQLRARPAPESLLEEHRVNT